MNKYFIYFMISNLGLLMLSCNDDYSNPKIQIPAPTELLITKTSAISVKLTWKDNSKGEDGFKIERTVIGTSELQTFIVDKNSTEFIDNTVEAKTYKYSVSAFYKERKSDPASIIYQHIPVGDPGNFKIEIKENKIELSWAAALGDIDGYSIERKINNASFVVLASVDKNTLKYVDENHKPAP